MRVSQGFTPTPAMELFAFLRARHGDDMLQKDLATKVRVRPEVISSWKRKPGFMDWLIERVDFYRADIHELLEQTAIARLSEFRFWEAMADKFGYYKRENSAPPPLNPPGSQPVTVEFLAEAIKLSRVK